MIVEWWRAKNLPEHSWRRQPTLSYTEKAGKQDKCFRVSKKAVSVMKVQELSCSVSRWYYWVSTHSYCAAAMFLFDFNIIPLTHKKGITYLLVQKWRKKEWMWLVSCRNNLLTKMCQSCWFACSWKQPEILISLNAGWAARKAWRNSYRLECFKAVKENMKDQDCFFSSIYF